MSTPGCESPVQHDTKRKYDGDGPQMRGIGKYTTTMDHRVSSLTATNLPLSSTKYAPEPLVPRDDDYYKMLYVEEPDFRLLGQRDPQFNAVLERGSHLDFTNPVSVMQLTKTLLQLDFGLLVDLPMDRLCPPVPNRHNYILWLKDLLDSSSSSNLDPGGPTRSVVGLDIGTGASLIYPLLGCAQRSSWSFIATDVDAKSLTYARKNAKLNNLHSRIRLVARTLTDCLIPLNELGLEAIDFVMVNPPFYTSEMELADLARQKSRPPNSAFTGAPIEMVCTGGEIGFIQRMIDESLSLKERVQWYTCMLGKQSSLEVLINILKERGVTNYAVTAFVQGNKTRRWAIGWSFGSRRPSLSASRGCEPSAGKRLLPLPTEATIGTWSTSPERLGRAICDAVGGLDWNSWIWDEAMSRGIGLADGNVWGRAYRRRRAKERETTSSASREAIQGDPLLPQQKNLEQCAFGFSVGVQQPADPGASGSESAVVVRWLQGNDYALFESLAGFLRKSIGLC